MGDYVSRNANPVLKSIAPVVERSVHVRIDWDRLKQFASRFMEGNIRHWVAASHVDLSGMGADEKLAFLFVFNSISFSYWGSPKWSVPLEGVPQRGTLYMLHCLRRAVAEGKPILNPDYLATIRREELAEILKGTPEIPLLDARNNILRQLGSVTATGWGGKFSNYLEAACGDAVDLLLVIEHALPSFWDEPCYGNDGVRVFFYKRAQLLVSDIHAVFNGEGYGDLVRTEKLTACADYILPMVLRHHGILVYSPVLADVVDNGVEVKNGSDEEIEIRANTVFAVELLKSELLGRFPGITSMQLNDYLWLSRTRLPEGVKHHLTRTTAY
ncbi:MAG: queuosine salvage family protein [Candidatus Micrarchaeota archaeon]